jgi:hypothetical protein
MKKRTAVFPLLLAAAFICFSFPGCSGDSDRPQAVSDTETKESEPMEFIVTYPDYNTKAFTISYDDCTVQDQKVMQLAKKYGVAVTFALNTAYWGQYG